MAGWNPTKILRARTTLDTSTGASRVETDQGLAVAKLLGNPEGPQALFCELLGTRAAAWLGLPTFDFAVVDVEQPGLVVYENGSASEAGPAFVTRYENGDAWHDELEELDAVENPEAFAGLIVLDTWLLNCDRYRAEGAHLRRNIRNVFFSYATASKGKGRLIAMDHTHCLTCGSRLTKAIGHIDRVKDERLYGNFPEFKPYLSHESVRKFAARLTSFRRPDAEQLLVGIPRVWGPEAEVKAAVLEFLHQRAGFVGQNIHQMLVDRGYLQPELDH